MDYKRLYLDAGKPFDALRINPEILQGLKPDAVRRVVELSSRIVAETNHPDRGGNGLLVGPAIDAKNMLIQLSDKFLMREVERHIKRSEEDGSYYKSIDSQVILNQEREHHIEDIRALIECIFAPKPVFKKALFELGISASMSYLREGQNSKMIGVESFTEPKFVVLDQELNGYDIEIGKESVSICFDSEYIDFKEGSGINDPISVRGGLKSIYGEQTSTELLLVPSKEWKHEDLITILGMVDREYIEKYRKKPKVDYEYEYEYEPKKITQRLDKDDGEQLVWRDAYDVDWLRYIVPAISEGNVMENMYAIVGNPQDNKIAILGLCRKIEL